MSNTKSHKTLPKRQFTDASWRVLAAHRPRGTSLAKHQHQTGQLLYAISGVMLVETDSARWTVPPQYALWIPPGEVHSIQMLSHTDLRTLYFQPELLAQLGIFKNQECVHAIVVTPLVQQLILELFNQEKNQEMHALIVKVLLLALDKAILLPIDLPMPSTKRLRHAAYEFLNTGHYLQSLADIAYVANMSERTFSRHFTAEVGLSFRAWRQRARIIASLDFLANQKPIKLIANDMGFASSAAYIAAFKVLLGRTPREFC
jgi:AraC-like DNA-binding protein